MGHAVPDSCPLSTLPHKVFEASCRKLPCLLSRPPHLPVRDRFSGLTQGPAELVTFTYSFSVRSQRGDRVSLLGTTLSHLTENMDAQAKLDPEAPQAPCGHSVEDSRG